MYYVIQRKYFDPRQFYLAFRVPKFIATKNSKNIIFEFQIEGKAKRKWAPKNDIVLLTEDKKLFERTLERFEKIADKQKEKVDIAQKKVEEALKDFEVAMSDEFFSFQNPSEDEDKANILDLLR